MNTITPNESDIPLDIIQAANKVEQWMTENGYVTWALLGICSRDHAYKVEAIETFLSVNYKTMIHTANGNYCPICYHHESDCNCPEQHKTK